ncbi:hypothetical protein C8F04DRAFT_140746 [Mycena alexandri]|uniref:Uncharacterized protein n=1 Tax=Mycena alexandri TaxID=1745969 RepID=A0AAD6SDZ6_9AGAR|nr:hypothetical protein C8F04DRAFT_140746 [Mycena alexandri]
MRLNLQLGPRGACGHPGCDSCAAFVAANIDGTPKYSDFDNPSISCFVCDHAWAAHGLDGETSAQNRLFARGGTLNGACNSFFSTDGVWNMRSVCVCGLPWAAHAVLAPVSEAYTSHTGALSGTSTASNSGATQRHAPTTAFAGLHRPPTTSVQRTRTSTSTVREAVQDQRRGSIQRNLHGNNTSRSSSTAMTSSVASSSSTLPSPRRTSGAPRSYSQPVPPLSSLSDFAEVPAITSAAVTVGILPKVLDTSDHNDMLDLSPVYSWKSGPELENAQTVLRDSGLTFVVDVAVNGPIFQTIDEGFQTHCRINSIRYTAPSLPSSAVFDSPHSTAWVILGPKGRTGNRSWVEDPKTLTRFTFNLQALRTLPFSYTANNLGEGPFIFIAPRFGNLSAPIDRLFGPATRLPEHVLVHRCFPRRVLHKFLSSLDGDPEPTCGPLCTPDSDPPPAPARHNPSPEINLLSDSDDEFPDPAALIETLDPQDSPVASSRAASPIVTRSVARQHWQQEAALSAALVLAAPTLLDDMPALRPVTPDPEDMPVLQPVATPVEVLPLIPGPLLATAMDASSISVKTRSFSGPNAPLDLTLRSPGSGANSFGLWQDHMLGLHADGDSVSIRARSVDLAARTLVSIAIWLFVDRPAGGLKLKEVLQEQFPSPRPTVVGVTQNMAGLFDLHVTVGHGIGKGPRNEVVAEALKILLADGRFWTQRESYKTLRLHPSRSGIPARACVLKATGLVLLLHFLFIGAPIPASPFLLSTILEGRSAASKFDPEFLRSFVSPGSLSLIKSLERVPLNMPMYASASEECIEYQILVNIPDVDPTIISPRRSQAEHDGVCSTVISYITLGTVDIAHHPDFHFISDGFNIVVPAFGGQDGPHHILEWFATPSTLLLLDAYDRQIKSPADIVDHLDFTETNPDPDPWGENKELVELISRFVVHYLRGTGHPDDSDQVIHALIGDNGSVANSILRATLFLSVLTGSTMLPVRPSWKIKCLITHDWSELYPTTDAAGREDFGPEIMVEFRSCFKTFTVTNNARLRRLLLSQRLEELPEGQDSHFGQFIHAGLLASRASYTAV